MNELAIIPSIDTSAIERAPLAASTRKQYVKAIQQMHAAGVNPSNHQALQEYAAGLKQSSKQFLKSALRLMTMDLEQELKANATPSNLNETTAALYRFDAMRKAVTVSQPKGQKLNPWLSRAQVVAIMDLCSGESLEQRRDWIVLGLLFGAGLRREELSKLTFEGVKTVPTKNGARTVIEVVGKGNKTRVIPINAKLAARLHEWKQTVNGGNIARSLGRSQQLGESMSAVAIFELCVKYGNKIGQYLPAHSCRRTFAQLAFDAGIPITQISVLLGHSDVSTTQKYLNLSLDLESTASDFIPL
jgi:integrase/recombinase XerD